MSGGFKRNKKDEDSGSGWKILGAAAVAGAIAAAAYGAKKLYDYMEEENAKGDEKQKEEKPKWEDDYYKEPLKVNQSDRQQSSTSSMQRPTTSSRLSSLYELMSKENMPLQDKLLLYYNGYVNIPIHEMERAKDVLYNIKKPILSYLQQIHPNIITELIDCGSTKEGLKVVRPDEFDIMIPLNVTTQGFSVEADGRVPGFFLLKKKKEFDMFSSLDNFLIHVDDSSSLLSPQKLRKHFQSLIQKAVNSIKEYKIQSGPKGPSITLHVLYDGNKTFTIDFVPVIVLGETQVVAKPHPEFLQHENKGYENYWRESFTQKEWDIIVRHSKHGACNKKCLKIAKAVRLNVSQLGLFNSYVFKTVLLHMLDESSPEEWEENSLQERFIDFFNTLLLYLRKGNLPHHFNPCVNLLEQYDERALENTKNYLSRIVTNNRFDNLLLKTDF